MKRKKMFLLLSITLATIAIIATTAWFINRHYNSTAYFLSQLPEKYKSYPALSGNIRTSHHEVKQLFSGKPRQIYYDSLHQQVVISRMEETTANDGNSILHMSYYRLDANGKVLDSLQESSATGGLGVQFAGHLLYEKYYTDYLTTGSTQPLSYVEKNADLSMEETSLRALMDSLNKMAAATRLDYSGDTTIVALSVNNQVHKVHLPSKFDIPKVIRFSDVFIISTPIEDDFPAAGNNHPSGSYPFMQVNYFLKEEYYGTRNPAFMSPAPMSRPAHWRGTGYYSISYTDDVLYFKHPLNYYPDKTSNIPKPHYRNISWGKLNFFWYPPLTFQLLTVGYDNTDRHALDGCYIVLKK
jgi:cell division protein FtsB